MSNDRDGARLRRMLAIAISVVATPFAAGQVCDTVHFPPPLSFDAGDFSTGIDAADLDGDGDLDLAISNRLSADVSVLVNRGGGSFMPPVNYAVGLSPRYVVAADYDGDGDIDLATCDRDSGTVSILLNAGDATFNLHEQIPLVLPTWLAAADFDGDGDTDIVVTLATTPSALVVLLNDGDAGLAEAGSWPVGIQPRGGAVVDLDGDERLDVAICNLTSDDLTILLGTGDGSFSTVSSVPAGIGPRMITAADLDGDGDQDLGVAHKDSDDIWVFRNDGVGNLTPAEEDRYSLHNAPHGIASADLDGDGDIELVVCNVNDDAIDILLNDGSGRFTPTALSTPYGESDVIVVDVGGDRVPDIVTANKNDMVSLYVNLTPWEGMRRVVYVDVDARPGGDGRTWATACDDLEAALGLAASSIDGPKVEVWVAAGRYVPRSVAGSADGPGAGQATIRIPAGLRVVGHFAGTECDPALRDLADPLCTTVLSGDLAGNDQEDFEGNEENAHFVVTADLRASAPPRPETVIDGFTITGGNAPAAGSAAGFDAVVPAGHALTLKNCVVSGNVSAGAGAGVCVRGHAGAAGLVDIVDTVITGNAAADHGGGVLVTESGIVRLRGCTITANESGGFGGGMHVAPDASSVTISDSAFDSNTAQMGGGLWIEGGPAQTGVTVAGSTFSANQADGGGGILVYTSTGPTVIRNCTISDNRAAGSLGVGGGVLVSGSDPAIVNCLIFGNLATGPFASGGGMYTTSGSPVVTNCTFSGNVAMQGGGLFNAGGGVPDLGNCVFWSNVGGAIAGQAGAETYVTRSIVQGGWDGPGGDNLDVDPLFHEPAEGDYRIASGSPCIDIGENAVILGVATQDLAGNARFLDDPGTMDGGVPAGPLPVVDLGAYEFACPADVDRSGVVEFNDFLLVLSAWGPCSDFCPEDLDGTGDVGFTDMVMVLAAWGPCN